MRRDHSCTLKIKVKKQTAIYKPFSYITFKKNTILYQTSVFDVKTPSMKASGDIHFTGTRAVPFFL